MKPNLINSLGSCLLLRLYLSQGDLLVALQHSCGLIGGLLHPFFPESLFGSRNPGMRNKDLRRWGLIHEAHFSPTEFEKQNWVLDFLLQNLENSSLGQRVKRSQADPSDTPLISCIDRSHTGALSRPHTVTTCSSSTASSSGHSEKTTEAEIPETETS